RHDLAWPSRRLAAIPRPSPGTTADRHRAVVRRLPADSPGGSRGRAAAWCQGRRFRRGLPPAQLHYLRAVWCQRLFAHSAPGGVLSPPALQTRDSGARRGQYVPLRGTVVGLLLPCRCHWAALVPSLSTSPPPRVVGALSLATLGMAQALLHHERALDPRAAHRASAQEILPRAAADVGRLPGAPARSEEHTSELQSPYDLVCRLLLEKKKKLHIRL